MKNPLAAVYILNASDGLKPCRRYPHANTGNAKTLRLTGYATLLLLCVFCKTYAQQQRELNSGWVCANIKSVQKDGKDLSKATFALNGWMPATVPGTVLTTLINNKKVPDPFYGFNNKQIPDIYATGRDEYTYWFVNDLTEAPVKTGEHVYLEFRGVNYSFSVFMNGQKVNDSADKGMFLRQSYDITPFLSKDGHNRLAVIVYPPNPVGNPNGGQGGDGMIAHSITNQFVAGWDWIQAIPDRNTGIWDKVFIKRTKQVNIDNTHVVTLVPGKRIPGGVQKPAALRVTTEVENTDSAEVDGVLQYETAGKKVSVKMRLEPHSAELATFPTLYIDSPLLWWPNGYGPQNLYTIKVQFLINGKTVSDEEQLTYGIRELKYPWNKKTKSRELRVNGQRIFIKGGDWILSDELLRFSKERYDAEIHFHRDMNLNLLRVWGGGITERPEFYDACDKYGLLVLQDLWVSGDCNGRWYDSLKLEDTIARRNYPDDHPLFVTSAEDQIKMLRNHPSLAIWCGGNEITPPDDIVNPIRDTLLRQLDGTRFFFNYSNDDSMSYDSHDGPYEIQNPDSFWTHHSWPFNSEVGSVGIGDIESLERFIPKEHLVPPVYDTAQHKWKVDPVWQYHKYRNYDSSVEAYGHPKNTEEFAMKAQLVNYEQYRALMEGFTAHMWDWYTGVIIWKTQNPWTAITGQMYDVYLDPNACLYGTKEGAKRLHVMYDPVHRSVITVNDNFTPAKKLLTVARFYDVNGHLQVNAENKITLPANSKVSNIVLKNVLPGIKPQGGFLYLCLVDSERNVLDENFYWLKDAHRNYKWLQKILPAQVSVTARDSSNGHIIITIAAAKDGPIAFFNRISLMDTKTKQRILPVFYNNNYISILPGEQRTIQIEFTPQQGIKPEVCIEGWNVKKQFIDIK